MDDMLKLLFQMHYVQTVSEKPLFGKILILKMLISQRTYKN